MESAGDPGHRRRVRVGDREPGLDRRRPGDEQADGLELAERLEIELAQPAREVQPLDLRESARVWRCRQAGHRVLLLARHVQGDACSDQAGKVRTATEQLGNDRACADHLLEVVEDEEDVALADLVRHEVDGRAGRVVHQPQRPGDRRRDQIRVADRLQGDEPHPVRMALRGRRRDLEREPGLAGPAGSGERQQPGALEQGGGLGDLPLAPDERGQLRRQIVRSGVERAQRREVGRQAIDDELAQALGCAEVLEPMLPEVAQGDAVGQSIAEQGTGRVADQGLAAVRDRGDAGGPIDGEADHVASDRFDLAAVEAHPDADRQPVGPRLRREPRWASAAAATASGAAGKITKNESPSVPCSWPRCAANAVLSSARCRSRMSRYGPVPSSISRRVEPSMSLNRHVTVPTSRSAGGDSELTDLTAPGVSGAWPRSGRATGRPSRAGPSGRPSAGRG